MFRKPGFGLLILDKSRHPASSGCGHRVSIRVYLCPLDMSPSVESANAPWFTHASRQRGAGKSKIRRQREVETSPYLRKIPRSLLPPVFPIDPAAVHRFFSFQTDKSSVKELLAGFVFFFTHWLFLAVHSLGAAPCRGGFWPRPCRIYFAISGLTLSLDGGTKRPISLRKQRN